MMKQQLSKVLIATKHNSVELSLQLLAGEHFLPRVNLNVTDKGLDCSIASISWLNKRRQSFGFLYCATNKPFFDIIRNEKVDKEIISYMLFNTPWNWNKGDITAQLHDELVAQHDLDTTQVMNDIFGI